MIEFNDQGAANPVQADLALSLIDAKADLRDSVNEDRCKEGQNLQDPLLIVVFIHGWHHGPQVCDNNLACFRRTLIRLRSGRDGPVVGIYLGWRGESHTKRNLFTLFGRKRVAQRIGRRDGLKVLLQIDDRARALNEEEEENVQLVAVGHSLGGALLHTAVQSKMLTEVRGELRVRPVMPPGPYNDNQPRRGFGDLVVFVNPAIEAWEYEPFAKDHRPRAGRPEIVTVASTADTAMGPIFTASRFVRVLAAPSQIGRGWANFRGLGRLNRQITHRLTYDGEPLDKPQDRRVSCRCPYPLEEYQEVHRELFEFKAVPGAASGSEFVVVQVDRTVIDGHNDIFNPRLIEFLAAAVRREVEFGLPDDKEPIVPSIETPSRTRRRRPPGRCQQVAESAEAGQCLADGCECGDDTPGSYNAAQIVPFEAMEPAPTRVGASRVRARAERALPVAEA